MHFEFMRMIRVTLTAALIAGVTWGITQLVAPTRNGYAATKSPVVSSDQTKLLQQLNQEQTAVAKATTPAVVSITGTKEFHQRGEQSPYFEDPFFKQFFGREWAIPKWA